MRRWLIVFLLLLVQFQFVWGAAASYCGHETKASVTKHFGHHDHRHQGADPKLQATDDDGSGSPAIHVDCESCHLGTSATVPLPGFVVALIPNGAGYSSSARPYSSHIPSGPERPDRSAHATAA